MDKFSDELSADDESWNGPMDELRNSDGDLDSDLCGDLCGGFSENSGEDFSEDFREDSGEDPDEDASGEDSKEGFNGTPRAEDSSSRDGCRNSCPDDLFGSVASSSIIAEGDSSVVRRLPVLSLGTAWYIGRSVSNELLDASLLTSLLS